MIGAFDLYPETQLLGICTDCGKEGKRTLDFGTGKPIWTYFCKECLKAEEDSRKTILGIPLNERPLT